MGLLSLDTWATFSVPPLEVIFTSIDLSEANLKQFYFINETKLNEPILFLYELPALQPQFLHEPLSHSHTNFYMNHTPLSLHFPSTALRRTIPPALRTIALYFAVFSQLHYFNVILFKLVKYDFAFHLLSVDKMCTS